MWLLTVTQYNHPLINTELLFRTVTEYQTFVDEKKIQQYSIRFINIAYLNALGIEKEN